MDKTEELTKEILELETQIKKKREERNNLIAQDVASKPDKPASPAFSKNNPVVEAVQDLPTTTKITEEEPAPDTKKKEPSTSPDTTENSLLKRMENLVDNTTEEEQEAAKKSAKQQKEDYKKAAEEAAKKEKEEKEAAKRAREFSDAFSPPLFPGIHTGYDLPPKVIQDMAQERITATTPILGALKEVRTHFNAANTTRFKANGSLRWIESTLQPIPQHEGRQSSSLMERLNTINQLFKAKSAVFYDAKKGHRFKITAKSIQHMDNDSNFSMREAVQMAWFAAQDSNMVKGGITLTGTAEERAKLFLAIQQINAGLSQRNQLKINGGTHDLTEEFKTAATTEMEQEFGDAFTPETGLDFTALAPAETSPKAINQKPENVPTHKPLPEIDPNMVSKLPEASSSCDDPNCTDTHLHHPTLHNH